MKRVLLLQLLLLSLFISYQVSAQNIQSLDGISTGISIDSLRRLMTSRDPESVPAEGFNKCCSTISYTGARMYDRAIWDAEFSFHNEKLVRVVYKTDQQNVDSLISTAKWLRNHIRSVFGKPTEVLFDDLDYDIPNYFSNWDIPKKKPNRQLGVWIVDAKLEILYADSKLLKAAFSGN